MADERGAVISISVSGTLVLPPPPQRTWPGGTGVPAWGASLAQTDPLLLPRLALLRWCFVGSRAAFQGIHFLNPAGIQIAKKKRGNYWKWMSLNKNAMKITKIKPGSIEDWGR